ncbi:hypothetical protein Tco_0224412, partial [Tanacetum coccineum]
IDLFTKHDGYDILEYTANDNLVAKNFSDNEESDVNDYDGNGNFIGARSEPMPLLIGNNHVEEDDGNGYHTKDKKKAKNKQNRARDGEDKVKS